MGKFAKLINMPMEQLRDIDLGADFAVGEGQKIKTEQDRYDVILTLAAELPDSITLYSTKSFAITWRKRRFEVPKGEFSVAAALAFFLLRKYGLDNTYGNLAKYNSTFVHDEPKFTAKMRKGEPQDFDFTKKAEPVPEPVPEPKPKTRKKKADGTNQNGGTNAVEQSEVDEPAAE